MSAASNVPPMDTKTIQVANLTKAERWALDQIVGLFADDAQAELRDAWLSGEVGLRFDPERGVLAGQTIGFSVN